MNNFINTINVEGVDYDIQTSVNPPLKYLDDNLLHLNIGTGLDIYQGDLIADITHNFDHFNSIIIDPEYWSIDNRGRLLPPSTLQIGEDANSLKTINTLLIGTGLDLQDNLLRSRGIPISTDGGFNTQYINQLILGTGLQVSDNVIDIIVPISTDAGSSISYINSLNIGQGLKYDNNELSVDSIYTEGGILICTEDGSFESAERVTGIKISNDFNFDPIDNLLSLNFGFGSIFTVDESKHVQLKYDNETLTVKNNGLQLSTNIKGLGYLPNDTYGIKTTSPLYINDDNQVSINIGTGLHLDLGNLSITYDATYFTINDIGELTLNDTVKEKLGL